MAEKRSTSVVHRVAHALRKHSRDGLARRVSDRFALPQLYKMYSENFLTQGEQFLKGPDEMPLFAPGVWHAPLKWRPIPGPSTASLSRATLSTTDDGHALLRGHFGGSRGDMALLTGEGRDTERAPVGAGACGVASTGHWQIDLTQHHWVELMVRTGDRAFELIVQSDGQWEGSERLWRAAIPAAPIESDGEAPTRATRRGAYALLGVEPDATNDDIRKAYRSLARRLHPDRVGGDEEQFKRVSRAYSLIEDEPKRKVCDAHDDIARTTQICDLPPL